MKIINIFSPNFDKKKRLNRSIKLIIIHYTGMQSERESLNKLINPISKVSSHYLINEKGVVYRLVLDSYVAWHSGKSDWGKFKNLNKNSIGIELVNKGHKFGYRNFKKKQIKSLIELCKILIKKYKIKKKNIVGHSDIAPLRKMDPGEKFPWKKLFNNGIGIWHRSKSDLLKRNRNIKVLQRKDKIKFNKILSKIGYRTFYKNKSFTFKILKAFQRRFRQDLISGYMDKECLIIAKNLTKNL